MHFVGIDTSCYTTSAAVVDEDGTVIWDRRIPLVVEKDGRGLRQSEMVFQHIKNIPLIMSDDMSGASAVAASVTPRPVRGSYMPVFKVAEAVGEAMAASSGCKCIRLTHQHGHIGAAMLGEAPADGQMIGIHVSGGTTDTVRVTTENGVIKRIDGLGSTSDISAGQMIDRVGVALGLPFPAGDGLEGIAADGGIRLRAGLLGMSPSFSGAESAAQRLIKSGAEPGAVAFAVLSCVAKTLSKIVANACESTGLEKAVLFGGVLRNNYIRSYLSEKYPGTVSFAKREYASDNACGLADQARLRFLEKSAL